MSANNRAGRRQSYVEEDEGFLRRLVIPEEDRARLTTAPWNGGFRWFRSQNVTCLEKYRRAHRGHRDPNGRK
jgi:hypothetical protein